MNHFLALTFPTTTANSLLPHISNNKRQEAESITASRS